MRKASNFKKAFRAENFMSDISEDTPHRSSEFVKCWINKHAFSNPHHDSVLRSNSVPLHSLRIQCFTILFTRVKGISRNGFRRDVPAHHAMQRRQSDRGIQHASFTGPSGRWFVLFCFKNTLSSTAHTCFANLGNLGARRIVPDDAGMTAEPLACSRGFCDSLALRCCLGLLKTRFNYFHPMIHNPVSFFWKECDSCGAELPVVDSTRSRSLRSRILRNSSSLLRRVAVACSYPN